MLSGVEHFSKSWALAQRNYYCWQLFRFKVSKFVPRHKEWPCLVCLWLLSIFLSSFFFCQKFSTYDLFTETYTFIFLNYFIAEVCVIKSVSVLMKHMLWIKLTMYVCFLNNIFQKGKFINGTVNRLGFHLGSEYLWGVSVSILLSCFEDAIPMIFREKGARKLSQNNVWSKRNWNLEKFCIQG